MLACMTASLPCMELSDTLAPRPLNRADIFFPAGRSAPPSATRLGSRSIALTAATASGGGGNSDSSAAVPPRTRPGRAGDALRLREPEKAAMTAAVGSASGPAASASSSLSSWMRCASSVAHLEAREAASGAD